MIQELMHSDADEEDCEPQVYTQAANDQEVTNMDSEEGSGVVLDAVALNYVEPAATLSERMGDLVHKALRLHSACSAFINTEEFSRLASLRQLGVAYHLFPSATHTRREHSIGVSYLALEMMVGLMKRSRTALDVTPREVRNVALAGLCHDLGHGPLSHVFEKEFLRRTFPDREKPWEHEDMSIKMLELIRTKYKIDNFDEGDIQFMKKLIQGLKSTERTAVDPKKRFLYDIISNDHNGIDVDRMDYLQRDALLCGAGPLACNLEELLGSAEVVGDQICYPLSQLENVWSVFTERVRLFREVYTHWRTKSAEFMSVEALAAADKALQFSEFIWEAQDFLHLTDALVSHIETYHILNKEAFKALSVDQKESLAKAQELLRRLRRRDLYLCCGVCEVPDAMLLGKSWEGADAKSLAHQFTAAKVTEDALDITAADIILDINKIDYAKEGRDPMATVGFFDDGLCASPEEPRSRVLLTQDQLDNLPGRPMCFKIRTLRVFVRKAEHCGPAAAAFRRWCEAHLGPDAVVKTGVEAQAEGLTARPSCAAPAAEPRIYLSHATATATAAAITNAATAAPTTDSIDDTDTGASEEADGQADDIIILTPPNKAPKPKRGRPSSPKRSEPALAPTADTIEEADTTGASEDADEGQAEEIIMLTPPNKAPKLKRRRPASPECC